MFNYVFKTLAIERIQMSQYHNKKMKEIITNMAHNQPGIFLVAKRGGYARRYPELAKIAWVKLYEENKKH